MERKLFGVPAVLTTDEAAMLTSYLRDVWQVAYARDLGELEEDLSLCKRFFDPLARGHSIRERLAQLTPVRPPKANVASLVTEELVTDVGEGCSVVGVEARLVLHLLAEAPSLNGHVVISAEACEHAQADALSMYRAWSRARLGQVVALRTGQGREVMQAVSVGIVLALLVNRSDCPERAVIQWDHTSMDGTDVNRAVYAAAERFASALSGSVGRRSTSEKRLKGGYGVTEARRRLAHRLVITKDSAPDGGALLYVPSKHKDEVVEFIARDLARRSNVDAVRLAASFDQLVLAFRGAAADVAHHTVISERPADTSRLRQQLLSRFEDSRSRN